MTYQQIYDNREHHNQILAGLPILPICRSAHVARMAACPCHEVIE